ncbi:S41 family peptidase [Deminuibacter soli]|uniref:Tail specific protease domain-containing protein n=1 Tax=Deminuibacter soli TaxID=2291815 RepID=A0A3E1NHG0_9BACT|nr:S41 family peptidase [Deminuibacter soli]RFM27291.1 hypothetical protein DXN05_14785 [Deminuibacter soli]
MHRLTLARIYICICFAAMLLPAAAYSQSKAPQTNAGTALHLLPVKNMRNDLTLLWQAIQHMHPAYGLYYPADSLQLLYRQTLAAMDTPATESAFMSHIYPLLSKLACGHTQLKHSAGYTRVPSPHLPFEVLAQHHRAWVTTHQVNTIATGDEIHSINGIDVKHIIAHGYNLYAGDGYNETFKELFLSEYDGFEDACNDLHLQPPYRLVLTTKDGVHKQVTVSMPAGNATMPATAAQSNAVSNWITDTTIADGRLQFLKHQPVAWFRAGAYQYSDTLLFKEVFQHVHDAHTRTLILDLRHNTGGDIRVAAKLLSYLADAPYHMISRMESRIPNPAINGFEQYFDTDRTAGFNEGFYAGKQAGNWYQVNFKPAFGDVAATLPLSTVDHFDGRLLVLIDGATFSAGAHTAAAIRAQCRNARFIGRETAGNEEGCSGGTIQHFTLPNTGIVVEFPWMRVVSVAQHPVPGRGVMPDDTVEYTAADIVQQNDLDIQRALLLVEKYMP